VEELFRFILTRPAQVPAEETPAVQVQMSGDYQKELGGASVGPNARSARWRVASAHMRSETALRSLEELETYRPAVEIRRQLDAAAHPSLNDLARIVDRAFGAAAADVVASDRFREAQVRAGDALVTDIVLGRPSPVAADALAEHLRILAFVSAVAARDQSMVDPDARAALLDAILVLPQEVTLRQEQGSDGRERRDQPPRNDDSRADELRAKRDDLRATYLALTRIEPEHLVVDAVETPERGVRVPKLRDAVRGLPPVAEIEEPEREPGRWEAHDVRDHSNFEAEALAAELEEGLAARHERVPVTAADVGTATGLRGDTLRLKPEVARSFAPAERQVLEDRGIDLARVELARATTRLATELEPIELELAAIEAESPQQMVLLGGSFVPAKDLLLLPYPIGGGGGGTPPAPPPVPTTHGTVAPAGIGDLLVVRQNLKKYEARELAHIENILEGEYKERMHRRARTTEETVTVEEEVKKEEERDLQTTERFELKTESSIVQKQDASLKIGLAVSGKYGPVVEFKATTDFATSSSKEESKKVATDYSKDVTSRASSKIFERHREERILKTIEVFEEVNKHGFDNKEGDGPVVGQYQWVDKVYEAQVFNYGKRLLFDIMLPEPAAFLLHATSTQPKGGDDLVKPSPLYLTPSQLTEFNYSYYIKQYSVIGVDPPPQPYMTTSKVVEGTGEEKKGITKSLEIPIPEGYQAIKATLMETGNYWGGGAVDVVIDKNGHRWDINANWAWSLPLSNETGSIAMGIKTLSAEAFTVEIEVNCQRTDRALAAWRLKTFDSIVQAYQKQLRDYQEALAAREVEAANNIQGRNPLENERLVRAELKKGALTVLTAQQFDLFGAIGFSSQGYPEPDLPEADAEGKYIRFFEQAFEWEQMMWFFYPYFWGRKDYWTKRALLQDVDPVFADFIRAGSARVVLAVRPGFENAVATFLTSGTIWDGGDLPPVTSPLYVSIIDEIRERDHAPGDEIEQGAPWDVRLPTTLVKLRNEASLPSWHKDATGQWIPD
jgi:hypothetical protein